YGQLNLGVSYAALARWQLSQGVDPMSVLAKARAALARALQIDPNVVIYKYQGEVELLAARWAMDHRGDPTPAFVAAETATRKALAADGKDADVLGRLAEI